MAHKIPRNNRAFGVAPQRNVDCAYVIGVTSESARFTFELALTDSVLPADMLTVWASLAGIFGADEYHGNPLQQSFVLDEVCQLPECPRTVVATLSPPSNRCLTYALQVFEGYGSVSAFGFRNYVLGNGVIDVGLEPSLVSSQASQMSFCTLSSAGLESSSQAGNGISSALDGASAESTSIRIYCQCLLPEVHAENPPSHLGRWLFFLTHNNQVENTLSKHELTLKAPRSHIIKARVSEKRNMFSSSNRQNRDRVRLKGERSRIIFNGPKWSESRLSYLRLEASTDFVDCPSRHLSREMEPFSHFMVGQVVCSDTIGCLSLNQNCSDVGTSFVESTHGITKKACLLISWLELQFVAEEHNSYWPFNAIRISQGVGECSGGMLG